MIKDKGQILSKGPMNHMLRWCRPTDWDESNRESLDLLHHPIQENPSQDFEDLPPESFVTIPPVNHEETSAVRDLNSLEIPERPPLSEDWQRLFNGIENT